MRMPMIALFVALTAGLVGCGGAGIGGSPPHVYSDGNAMVAEALKGISEISADDLRAKLEKEEMFLLIDLRDSEEYWEECIDGAFNIPRGVLEFRIGDKRFWDDEGMYVPEKDEEIIVYCENGKAGALAAQTLMMLGYGNVQSLYGGWVVWKFGPEALDAVEAEPETGGCG